MPACPMGHQVAKQFLNNPVIVFSYLKCQSDLMIPILVFFSKSSHITSNFIFCPSHVVAEHMNGLIPLSDVLTAALK